MSWAWELGNVTFAKHRNWEELDRQQMWHKKYRDSRISLFSFHYLKCGEFLGISKVFLWDACAEGLGFASGTLDEEIGHDIPDVNIQKLKPRKP